MSDEKCKCGFHPDLNSHKFDWLISEFGMMDKVLKTEEIATCKTCKDEFKREWK